MIYLASPYSHRNPRIREQRFQDACRAAAHLVADGHAVFSPIVHSHPLVSYGLPTDWQFWAELDREYLRHCNLLMVLTLDGWTHSRGVKAEIELAEEFNVPIRYLLPAKILNMTQSFASIRDRESRGMVAEEGGDVRFS